MVASGHGPWSQAEDLYPLSPQGRGLFFLTLPQLKATLTQALAGGSKAQWA